MTNKLQWLRKNKVDDSTDDKRFRKLQLQIMDLEWKRLYFERKEYLRRRRINDRIRDKQSDYVI